MDAKTAKTRAGARKPIRTSAAAAEAVTAVPIATVRLDAAARQRPPATRISSGDEPHAGVPEPRHARALEELAARRAQYLAFARKRLRSNADAEDLLQQAMQRAVEKIESLRDPNRVDAWFYRLLRRTLVDHHVAWAKHQAELGLLAAEVDEGTHEERAMCGCSLGLLATLRPEYADIVTRIDLNDDDVESSAQKLGISTNNAYVRLSRAREALRRKLKETCGTESTEACQSCACEEMPSDPTAPREFRSTEHLEAL